MTSWWTMVADENEWIGLRLLQLRQMRSGFLLHIGVQAVAVRVHGNDGDEIVGSQMPHRLGNSELHEIRAQHRLDRTRIILRRAPDGVEVHGAGGLQRIERLLPHASFADYRAHAEVADDIGLIGFLPDAGGRARRLDGPGCSLPKHYRTAVI